MSKKIILVIFPLIIFFSFHTAQATVVINEIMYDLDGGDIDYVEVVNQGETGIDLSTFKLLISNSTSNHAINSFSGSPVLLSGKYGVIIPTSSISKYVDKWGNSGNIFTSSFSLPNSTAKVEINDGDKTAPISSVTYDSSQGASGDGESLQFLGGSWVSASPTPGVENQPSSSSASDSETSVIPEDEGTTPSSSNITKSQKENPTTKQEIKAKISVKDFSFSGIPLSFNVTEYPYAVALKDNGIPEKEKSLTEIFALISCFVVGFSFCDLVMLDEDGVVPSSSGMTEVSESEALEEEG